MRLSDATLEPSRSILDALAARVPPPVQTQGKAGGGVTPSQKGNVGVPRESPMNRYAWRAGGIEVRWHANTISLQIVHASRIPTSPS